MAVPAGPTEKRYTGNGVTTIFTIPFLLILPTDLEVFIDGVTQTSGYVITGAGNPTSTITFTPAPADGADILLQLNVPFERLNDYQENGDFLSTTVNRDFDRIWQALKQLLRWATRSLMLGDSDVDGSGWYRAKNNGIRDLRDPEESQDAATKKWTETLIADIIETGQGPINNAANVIYVAPDMTITTVQAMSGNNGSNLIGFIAAEPGAVLRPVQSKLRDIISRGDYSSSGAFDAAKPGRVSIAGDGRLNATVFPTGGGSSTTLEDIARDTSLNVKTQFPFAPRPVVRYASASSVTMHANTACMGEFRFMGGFTGGRGRVLPLATQIASTAPAGLGAESAFRTENWYAAFACANSGDSTATIKTMPYLRVHSVAGLDVNLNKAGEGIHTAQAQTYAWTANNNLSGRKCLVISEGGGYSGRVATITANVPGKITLDNVGTLAFGDFLLPAPPGFTEFGYLGSFYMDTAEVRNIYDSGSIVKSKGIFVQSPSTNGSIPAPGVQINCAGYICPLATAVILDSSANMSTASTGDVAEYFDVDGGNHIVQTGYVVKSISTSATYIFDGITVPFLYPWRFNYANAGSLAASRVSSQLNMTGWLEP
ncbi:hypothetical protein [Pseudomonas donghuensis]|uniref:hypothetical protein n=1 Tax=Pseudomonas donghuensis TaxID=1163398 RepID=UPI002160D4AC|nr:hypothetical protein [Pseudomonas donghuensis]UVL22383.1 hypothetical protein LOY30_16105 [Pseudomonas donghuensis]